MALVRLSPLTGNRGSLSMDGNTAQRPDVNPLIGLARCCHLEVLAVMRASSALSRAGVLVRI